MVDMISTNVNFIEANGIRIYHRVDVKQNMYDKKATILEGSKPITVAVCNGYNYLDTPEDKVIYVFFKDIKYRNKRFRVQRRFQQGLLSQPVIIEGISKQWLDVIHSTDKSSVIFSRTGSNKHILNDPFGTGQLNALGGTVEYVIEFEKTCMVQDFINRQKKLYTDSHRASSSIAVDNGDEIDGGRPIKAVRGGFLPSEKPIVAQFQPADPFDGDGNLFSVKLTFIVDMNSEMIGNAYDSYAPAI